jgi:hypothetical protein
MHEETFHDYGGPRLEETLALGVELPGNVFTRRFGQYLFFDIDVTTSEPLIVAVRQVVMACFGSALEVDVYKSSDRSFLKRLGADEEWAQEIMMLSRAMRKEGDVDGMILLDGQNRWILYQLRPVDFGVFAIDCHQDLMSIAAILECFFALDDVKDWLSRRTSRDKEMVHTEGEGFLAALRDNYS